MYRKLLTPFSAVVAAILLLLVGSKELIAQTASFQAPLDTAQNVSLRPTLVVRTSSKIDSSSITWTYPNLDSNIWSSPNKPTIILMPRVLKDSLSDTLWKFVYTPGEYQLENDSTLTFTPFDDLHCDFEYTAFVSGLRVLEPSMTGVDTVLASNDSVTFRTVLCEYSILAETIGTRSYIGCSDTIKLAFNRPLTSTTTGQGDIVTIDKLDSVTKVNDSTYQYHKSAIACNSWINTYPGLAIDSVMLNVTPTQQLIPGEQYFVNYNVGYLTGDTLDNLTYSLSTREAFSLKLSVRAEDSTDTLSVGLVTSPDTSTVSVVDYASTTTISAIPEDSNFVFLHWECPGVPEVDGNTSSTVEFARSCSDVSNLNITAVYRRQGTISVTVDDNDCLGVYVYSENLDSLGGVGIYTLPAHSSLYVAAVPNDSTCTFSQWSSNRSEYNGVSQPLMKIINRGENIGLEPISTDPLPINNMVCTEVSFVGGIEKYVSKSDVITVVPDPCTSTGAGTAPVSVMGIIKQDLSTCFCIDKVIVQAPGQAPVVYNANCSIFASIPGGVVPTTPKTTVTFVVKQKGNGTYKLTVSTELTNTRFMDDLGRYPEIGPTKEVTIQIRDARGELIGSTTDQDYEADFPCGTRVSVHAVPTVGEEGFSFTEWYSTTPYNAYPSPTTKSEFSILMDEDKYVKGQFQENFRLRQIGFFVNDTHNDINEVVWISTKYAKLSPVRDIDIYGTSTATAYGGISGGSKYGTEIFFKTNDAIEVATVPGKIAIQEITDRIDEFGKQYWPTTSGNTSLVTGTNDKVLKMDVWRSSVNPLGLPKGMGFRIDVGSFKNISGESVYNQGAIGTHETEMPGLILAAGYARSAETSGDGNVELITDWGGKRVFISPTGTASNEDIGSIHFGPNEINPDDNSWIDYTSSSPYYTSDKVNKNDVFMPTATAYDHDTGIDIDWGFLGIIAGGVIVVVGFVLGLWLGLFTGLGIAYLLGLGQSLAFALGALGTLAGGLGGLYLGVVLAVLANQALQNAQTAVTDNENDFLGMAAWVLTWSQGFFGAKTTVRDTIRYARSGIAQFRLRNFLKADE